jgi:predicted alpha-1,6-mannanase (GH76 family)
MRSYKVFLSVFIVAFTVILLTAVSPAYAADYRSYANTGAAKLYSQYDQGSGKWSTGWWQSANHLTTLIDYMLRGGSNDYTSIIANTYDKNKTQYAGDFRNEFIDDSGWWALAWLRAYDKTGQTRYRDTAKVIADYMHQYWDTSTCNGGVWWTTGRTYKNAITVELYIKVNAAYYNRGGSSTYLTRAQTAWDWFVNSGMINSSNLVNDGLNSSCQNNGDTVWTYNQGVILGAAAELHRATNNGAYLDKAQQIASAAMNNLKHGITGALRENGCESGNCGADGALFKGIFMRNLYELNARRYNSANQNFITLNADVIWANNRSNDQFGLFWSGPYEGNDASRQSSALDALVAAIQYSTSSGNLARNATATASGQCASSESAAQAKDGNTGTKWCAGLTNGVAWLQMDIAQNNVYSVRRFVVKHAGAGGESSSYNTRDYTIQGSSDASTWYDLVTVTGNTSNERSHTINAVGFRYFRLRITNPQTATSFVAARVYEFEIYEN